MNEYVVLEGLSQEVGSFTMMPAYNIPPRKRQRAFRSPVGPARVVLTFRAPTWEDAMKVFDWAHYHRRGKVYSGVLSWRRVRRLLSRQEMRELAWRIHTEVLQCMILDDPLEEGT